MLEAVCSEPSVEAAVPPRAAARPLPVRRWLLHALLLVGPVVGVAVVGLGAPRQSRPERQVLGGWLTASTAPWRALALHVEPSRALIVAVAALVVTWLGAAALLRSTPVRRAVVGWAAAAWAAPFALGPPMLSRDAYAYLAQGEVLRRGMNPYTHPAAVLGQHSSVLQAVDPMWRHTLPPYGPLALRLEELASWLGMGHEAASLVALRVLALVGVAVMAVLVAAMTPAAHRSLVLWLTMSPLVLLQLIAPAHLEALLCALVAGVVFLVRREQRAAAAVAAVVATEIKATMAVVVLALVLHTWSRHGWPAVRNVLLAAAATAAAGVLLLPGDPFGWVRAMGTPGLAWNPFTPSSELTLLLSEGFHHLGLATPDGLQALARDVLLAVGVVLGVVVVRRGRTRSFSWVAAMLLLVVSVTGPVLWPWYLSTCALLLLLARLRVWAAGVAAAAALAALPVDLVLAQRVSTAAELIALAGVIWTTRERYLRRRARTL